MLIVHASAQRRIDILGRDLPQSVLLSGVRGVGLASIGRDLAGSDLVAEVRPRNTKEQVDSEHGTISIAMIRELYSQTRTKTRRRQIILIDDADKMSRGAQAAFLKLLEEPQSQVYFILTSHSAQRLLPTIRSRIQETTIEPVTAEQTTKFIELLKITDPTKRAQLQFIASGLPAELMRLTTDVAYFAQRAAIMGDARTLLQASAYEKLLIAGKYQSDREQALQLIDSTLTIARRSLSSKPQSSLVVQLDKLLSVREAIAGNANIRLQLAQFVL